MKKYTYRNKKTGKKIESDKPLISEDLIIIMRIKDGMIKNVDSIVIKK